VWARRSARTFSARECRAASSVCTSSIRIIIAPQPLKEERMQRIRYSPVLLALGCTLAIVSAAHAGDGRSCPGVTPDPNAGNIATRVFNDCPISILNVTNLYPASIQITDANLACFGFANLHTWSFSEDGGVSKAQFENCSAYRFCADVNMD